MKCPGCGLTIADDSKFCQGCGYKIGKTAQEPPRPAETTQALTASPLTQRTNRIVIYSAVAVVAFVILGIVWAVDWKHSGDEQPAKAEPSQANNQAPLETQTQNAAADGREQTAEVLQQPARAGASAQAYQPKRKPAPSAGPFDGRWEGTWRTGGNDSGECSVSVRNSRFNASCYNSRFSGAVTQDRRGHIRFEGHRDSWTCVRGKRGRASLLCSFSAGRMGAESVSGELTLYR
jgi:hypothetical protein